MSPWAEETELVVAAAAELDIRPREAMWVSASLCVLDSVWSIGAKYDSVVVPLVRRFAQHHGVTKPVVQPKNLPAVDPVPTSRLAQCGEAQLIDLTNRQRTSTRSGISKAEASIAYARVLSEHNIETMADGQRLLLDERRLALVEADLRGVRGHGAGVRMGYLWMLLGNDHAVKPDRMITRWLERAVNRRTTVAESRELLADASYRLGVTPWELDRAIWLNERNTTFH